MRQIIKYLLITLLIFTPLLSVDFTMSSEKSPGETISIMPSPESGTFIPAVDPLEYVIGVGDRFMVEKLQEQKVYILTVLPTGFLSIPGLEEIKISGMTLKETLEKISREIGEYVNISFYAAKSIQVSVVGAVQMPGVHKVKASTRLSSLLRNIPLLNISKDYAIEIRNSDSTKIINIYDYYLNGDLDNNPYLHANEIIYIPYADMESECVQVFGQIVINDFYQRKSSVEYIDAKATKGLVPLIAGETLYEFNKRKIHFNSSIDPAKIIVIRNSEQLALKISAFKTFELQAGDQIEYIVMESIFLSGYVNIPGTYGFVPKHTVQDYISMAGGLAERGSMKSVVILRGKEKIFDINNINIQRGDIILVKRALGDFLIGETSVLDFILMLASITATVLTAFIAAGN